jgi:uncharacterized protein (DUF2384 family)
VLRAKAARAVPRRKGPVPAPKAVTEAAVLTKAVVRAARLLSFSQRDLGHILGVSDATASRLCAGSYELSPARTKEWELALLLVRLFRSLDALWGHEEAAHAWLTTDNLALAARPADLVSSVEGLVRVVNYLDNARGRL